jgi:lipid A 4'-phosphatase
MMSADLHTMSPSPAAAQHPRPLHLLRGAVPVWLLAVVGALSLLFVLLPQVDLAISGWFARGTAGFPLQHHPVLDVVNDNVLRTSRGAGVLLLALVAAGFVLPRGAWPARHRRMLAFLLVSLALGPGLVVNTLLKDHFGRARPVHVEQFGGTHHYTPAFVPADQCERNCAFVSGHTAAATMPVAGYFVAATRRRRRLWLAGGLALGAAVGLVRVAVGAHFLSDVVIGMFITWVACALAAAVLLAPRAAAAATGAREVRA